MSEVVLHMQQVLGCELTEAEDAQKVEVCQVACVLRIQVTKSYNANYLLQRVQISVPDLQACRTCSCYTCLGAASHGTMTLVIVVKQPCSKSCVAVVWNRPNLTVFALVQYASVHEVQSAETRSNAEQLLS